MLPEAPFSSLQRRLRRRQVFQPLLQLVCSALERFCSSVRQRDSQLLAQLHDFPCSALAGFPAQRGAYPARPPAVRAFPAFGLFGERFRQRFTSCSNSLCARCSVGSGLPAGLVHPGHVPARQVRSGRSPLSAWPTSLCSRLFRPQFTLRCASSVACFSAVSGAWISAARASSKALIFCSSVVRSACSSCSRAWKAEPARFGRFSAAPDSVSAPPPRCNWTLL